MRGGTHAYFETWECLFSTSILADGGVSSNRVKSTFRVLCYIDAASQFCDLLRLDAVSELCVLATAYDAGSETHLPKVAAFGVFKCTPPFVRPHTPHLTRCGVFGRCIQLLRSG